MATRSFIAVRNVDGSVNGIYCHHDGYPEGVGATLKEHYASEDKVRALLALGDISVLGAEIGEKHDGRLHSEWTYAYHRDRGDDLDPNMTYGSVVEAVKCAWNDLGAEHVYIYNPQDAGLSGRCWTHFSTTAG